MKTTPNPKDIQAMFAAIAKKYDRGNAILSFNRHRKWNATLVDRVLSHSHRPKVLLDLCAGTGDIAFSFLEKSKEKSQVILLDFCREMIHCARLKSIEKNLPFEAISYIKGDAQHIPLDDHSVDAITIAYGIRNVQDPSQCVAEAFRVLRPGGCFGILELTRPTHPVLRMGHTVYLRAVLPLLGKLFIDNREAYCYLSSSIQKFMAPAQMKEILDDIGFVRTSTRPLLGGVATMIWGEKSAC